jgi:diguanylate cyclase (GGDEF)-like protein
MLISFFSRPCPSASNGAFHRRASKAAIAAALVTLVASRFFSFANLIEERNEQQQSSVQSINNISVLVKQDIERNIELYDHALVAVGDRLSHLDLMPQNLEERQRLLFDARSPNRQEGMGPLVVLDESGTVVLDSESVRPRQASLSDREYFRVHQASADVGLYISHPLHNRLRNGEWTIVLSRRINHPDGSFAGVVGTAIALDQFQRLFTKVVLTANDSITLFDTEGTILVRWPFMEAVLGQSLDNPQLLKKIDEAPDGHITVTSYADGAQRLNDYRRIGNLPLIQKVGISVRDTSNMFWLATGVSVMCFIVLCAAVVVLMLQLESELRRRQAAETALEELATTDELTGLANRRKFDDALAFEWRRAERENTPFSLLMLDADLFKSYNDTYGHQAGDEVLRRIAECIRAGVKRPADLAARYGGEEFAVLLPATDHSGAFHIAEAIRTQIFSMGLPHEKSLYGVVTASVGVACMYPRQTEDPAKLVRAADEALYLAKASGRNRVAPQQQAKVRRFA